MTAAHPPVINLNHLLHNKTGVAAGCTTLCRNSNVEQKHKLLVRPWFRLFNVKTSRAASIDYVGNDFCSIHWVKNMLQWGNTKAAYLDASFSFQGWTMNIKCANLILKCIYVLEDLKYETHLSFRLSDSSVCLLGFVKGHWSLVSLPLPHERHMDWTGKRTRNGWVLVRSVFG